MFDRHAHNTRVAREARQREQSVRRQRIEQEYGEPFRDVIKGFADDGESMTAVAAILGYSPRAFINLLEREGMRDWFPVDGRLGCNGVKAKVWVKK